MRIFLLGFVTALIAWAGPSGVVMNATTGEPEPRIPVTLVSFASGMDPIEEVYTSEDGSFAFEKELPTAGLLRAEHQGVAYSKVLPPSQPREGVEFVIFDASAEQKVPPTGRVLVLEPGAEEMVVNESYLFENQTDPPVTYRDADRGTLRFYLPPEAKGIVDVQATGPARMPLSAVAEKADEENIYKIDFPIKPGENRVSLSYLLPHSEDVPFVSSTLYPGIPTRIAVPQGVELEGEGLREMGAEPTTQAVIYETPGANVSVTIRGSGRLPRREQQPPSDTATGGAATEISIQPAPVAKELPWLIGIAAAVLVVGFVNLYFAGRARNKTR